MTARQLEQRDFQWPQGLYESAPFIYLAAGLWVSFRVDGPVAAIAGAFLTLAGLGTLYLRWMHRRGGLALLEDEASPPAAAEPEPCASSQGRVAAATHGGREQVDALIREVLAKLEARCELQEAVLRADPAAAAERWCEHRALAARIATLHRGYAAGKVARQALVECIVYEALVERTSGDQADGRHAFLADPAGNRRQ